MTDMRTPNLDAAQRLDVQARLSDALRHADDIQRYNDGERGAPFVLAAMQTFEIVGDNRLTADPHHNEMALAIVENPPSPDRATTVTFMYNRCLGHPSGYGVRMVVLEALWGAERPVWRVVASRFMPR